MKFLYVNTGGNYAPDKHLIDGLRENGHEVLEVVQKNNTRRKYFDFIKDVKKEGRTFDAIIVGYTLPLLVPIVSLLSRKKVFFNAISSQYEANIIARGVSRPWSFMAIKWWVVDFFSFHFSSKTLLESEAQINFIRTLFFVPQKKLVRAWMGVDEEVFFRAPNTKKLDQFTVLFRGRFLPESGILTVIEAAKLLEEEAVEFLIIGHGFLYREVNALMEKLHPKNITKIEETLSPKELLEKMLACHISLGQLADHPRLLRTLPAKLFESLALGLPYLTGRNAGALELLKENETCFAVSPGNAKELAEKILFLKNNPELVKKVAENGYALYRNRLTSKRLAQEFLDNCISKNK